MLRNILLAAALLAAPGAALAMPNPPPPACADAAHHAFDFWIGRWDVTDAKTGEAAGKSLIESLYRGCVIRENWIEDGYDGGSLNTYDAATGKWRQTWTDSANTWREYVGGIEDGKMVMVWSHASKQKPGVMAMERMTFTANKDGSVRQFSDASLDGGATWAEKYDYLYRRAK